MTQQHEHSTMLGMQGLAYGNRAAEEMIADRIRKLEERGTPGVPANRRTAINKLAAEGNLKTEFGASTHDLYLGDPARREIKAAQRERDKLDAAKREAAERGISLSEVMNAKACRGEIKL